MNPEHHVLRDQTFWSGPVPRLVELSGNIFGPLLLKFSVAKFFMLKISSVENLHAETCFTETLCT